MARRIFNVVHSDFTGQPIEILSYGHNARRVAESKRSELAKTEKHKDQILVIHEEVLFDPSPFEMSDEEYLRDAADFDAGRWWGEETSVRANRPSQS